MHVNVRLGADLSPHQLIQPQIHDLSPISQLTTALALVSVREFILTQFGLNQFLPLQIDYIKHFK